MGLSCENHICNPRRQLFDIFNCGIKYNGTVIISYFVAKIARKSLFTEPMEVHHCFSPIETIPVSPAHPMTYFPLRGGHFFSSVLVFFSFDPAYFSTSDNSGLSLVLTERKTGKKIENLTGRTIVILRDHSQKILTFTVNKHFTCRFSTTTKNSTRLKKRHVFIRIF